MLPTQNLRTERQTGAAFASPFEFKHHGQSGIEVSDLFPHVARCIDDIAVIRSMKADVPNHEPSLMLMNCGEARLVRPSVGSWVTYGLGSENQNLPGFIVMCPGGYPIQESQNWQSGFLPGVFQGTYVDSRHREVEKLIEHIQNKKLTKLSPETSSLICSNASTGNTSNSDKPILSSKPVFTHSSWLIACKWTQPTHSTSNGNPNTSATCMGMGSRDAKC